MQFRIVSKRSWTFVDEGRRREEIVDFDSYVAIFGPNRTLDKLQMK